MTIYQFIIIYIKGILATNASIWTQNCSVDTLAIFNYRQKTKQSIKREKKNSLLETLHNFDSVKKKNYFQLYNFTT